MLHARDAEFFLLPGTLAEILDYAEDRLTVARTARPTALADALIRSIAPPSDRIEKLVGASDRIQDEVWNNLRNRHFSGRDFYLKAIVERGSRIPPPYPKLKRNLFLQSIYQLSQGRRITKTRSNRSDALNYTLLAALNARAGAERYFLVSSSSYMQHVDKHVWFQNEHVNREIGQNSDALTLLSLTNRSIVITPRRAAIFRLIIDAGNGVGPDAARLSHELLAALREAQQRVTSRLTAGDDSSQLSVSDVAIRSDNVFLQIISSFIGMQGNVVDALAKKKKQSKSTR